MKKGLKILIIGALLSAIVVPSLTLAQDTMVDISNISRPKDCNVRHDITGLGDKFKACKVGTTSYETGAHCCLVDRILTFIDWFFWALIIISFFMLLIGAFNILTAGGNPDKVALGRKYLMFASIGLVLALLSFVENNMLIRTYLLYFGTPYLIGAKG